MKKYIILILAIIIIIAAAGLSLAWFGEDNSQDEYNVTLKGSDLSVDVELAEHTVDVTGVATSTANGIVGSFKIDGEASNYSIDGKIKLDSSQLDEKTIKEIRYDEIGTLILEQGDITYQCRVSHDDIKINDDTLTITLKDKDVSVRGFDATVDHYDLNINKVKISFDNSVTLFGSK